MKGHSGWGYRPYRPVLFHKEAELPFVTRLAPGETGIELEIIDNGAPEAKHVLCLREKDSEAQEKRIAFEGIVTRADGLVTETDYELWVERAEDASARSAVRYARTGFVPGTVVNYVHPEDEIYLFSGYSPASPSLVKLPSGALLASMDLYKGGYPQKLSLIYRSDDNGATWRYVTDVYPCFWGTLFMHRGRLYLLGLSTEYGDILISESTDEGLTWAAPSVLFRGSVSVKGYGPQRAPMPITEIRGRLYTSIEFGSWTMMRKFYNGILSVDADADLLVPENWHFSDMIQYDETWPGAPEGVQGVLLEGCLVEAPDGRILDILRMQTLSQPPVKEIAGALRVNEDDPDAAPTFDSFIALPTGSNSKTCIRRDPVTGRYWAMGNLPGESATQRSILALLWSDDLVSWHTAKVLLDYSHLPASKTGFQYPVFLFDGEDIIYLSRTAFNGAASFHDANYQTFHRIPNFRSL